MLKFSPASSSMSLVQTCALILLLLCAGLAPLPSWADQAQTDKAVASYLTVTVPAIETMKPYIGQAEGARAIAFAKMGLQGNGMRCLCR